jgi:FkbM family methyltransferase
VVFWKGLRVRVYPDWPYSWTAIYFRLTEYDDMVFALRYLRPGDAFIDVGANIGYYSLLASLVNEQAPVLALEPHPIASRRLQENASINAFANIRVRAVAVGRISGTAALTSDLVEQNRISVGNEGAVATVAVPVVTLDAVLPQEGIDPADVRLVKIDTEGFEVNVLAGANDLLDARPGPVWLVELAGLGGRYGQDDVVVRNVFAERGYKAFRYVANENRLVGSDENSGESGNVIFLREPEAVSSRLGLETSVAGAAKA